MVIWSGWLVILFIHYNHSFQISLCLFIDALYLVAPSYHVFRSLAAVELRQAAGAGTAGVAPIVVHGKGAIFWHGLEIVWVQRWTGLVYLFYLLVIGYYEV